MLLLIIIFFICSLREVADKRHKYGLPSELHAIRVVVKQVVVGPVHIGILLEDGRALRVAYSLIPVEQLKRKQASNEANSNNSKKRHDGSSSSRSLITVPEDLASQAKGNLAVNNLLSRDDEEDEDTEKDSDNYVPEDLISLLDGGFHSDNNGIIDADTR